MTDPISYHERQSYHLCLHPDCYLYKQYTRQGTSDENVWIGPAPVWTRIQTGESMFSVERKFAGYRIGVYNQSGIVHVLDGQYPLTIWQVMAREAVTKAQRELEERTLIKKGIDSCFT